MFYHSHVDDTQPYHGNFHQVQKLVQSVDFFQFQCGQN